MLWKAGWPVFASSAQPRLRRTRYTDAPISFRMVQYPQDIFGYIFGSLHPIATLWQIFLVSQQRLKALREKVINMAIHTYSEQPGWLKRSLIDIRTAFFEDASERSHITAITRPRSRQSSRDAAELAIISVVLCTAGLATVWSTTL